MNKKILLILGAILIIGAVLIVGVVINKKDNNQITFKKISETALDVNNDDDIGYDNKVKNNDDENTAKYDKYMFTNVDGDFTGIPVTINKHKYTYPFKVETLLKDWKYDNDPDSVAELLNEEKEGPFGFGHDLIPINETPIPARGDRECPLIDATIVNPTEETMKTAKEGYVSEITIEHDPNSKVLSFSCGDDISDVNKKYGDTNISFASGVGLFDDFEIEFEDSDDDGKIDRISIKPSSNWIRAEFHMYENGLFK